MSSVASPVIVSKVVTAAEMREALAVREAVFVVEQGVPEKLELDEHDGDPATVRSAVHVVARIRGVPVGAGRLLLDGGPGGLAHIGRVAVLREHRGRGVGVAVMNALHDEARRRGFAGIELSAQVHAIPFYERLGYQAYGEIYLDARIDHRMMRLDFR